MKSVREFVVWLLSPILDRAGRNLELLDPGNDRYTNPKKK
jgi:hypothetical protein